MNSEVLIYDFLPGTYEYERVLNSAKKVYNFYEEETLVLIDEFLKILK
ncbi:hypothetical protein PL321_13595 [Caloramator sp. mosi_1]|nr:hypothetical protein [Caloramator sp. mosi_1]WDC83636.1 hypothetical protein PL321_13595 [Caloramator sp. mosi_1]